MNSVVRNPRAGFTLIELMIVLMLITMFSALVVPSVVTATRQDSLSSQRDKVAELLRFASLSAITRHSSVLVHVDEARGVCRVGMVQPALPWLEEQASTETLATLRLPETVRIALTRTEDSEAGMTDMRSITFRSDGRADGTLLTLTGASDGMCAIEVVAATGEVLEREEGEQ